LGGLWKVALGAAVIGAIMFMVFENRK
jgi:hypothetical protein